MVTCNAPRDLVGRFHTFSDLFFLFRSILLHLVKAIDPDSVALPTRAKMKAGQHFENISNFLKAAKYVGVRDDELFSVPDLIDNHDWPKARVLPSFLNLAHLIRFFDEFTCFSICLISPQLFFFFFFFGAGCFHLDLFYDFSFI